MNAAELIRERFFWLSDAIKGGAVKQHRDEIKHTLENLDMAAAVSVQNEKLRKLLQHAVDSTEFYSRYKGTVKLSDLPVVGKNTMRSNFDAFVSGIFDTQEQIPSVTSGSTGTPFKVFHHRGKKKRNSADTIYFAGRTGFRPGQRLLYLKIWSKNNRKSRWLSWMQNVLAADVIFLNDQSVEAIISEMETSGSSYAVLGYSSALEVVCRYLEKTNHGKVKATVSSVISMSEALADDTKQVLKKHFGDKVYARYSNVENGILAQQVPGSGERFLVNTASYVVELLKMEVDQPAAAGEAGRIVVTDLYNYAFPMIRYDTGDVGIMSVEKDRNGNCWLEKIEGRKLDLLYATNGSLVSSYIVYKNMWQYTEIKQYQLIQSGEKEYLFKINMEGAFKREAQLVSEFKTYLGGDAEFSVEYVDEIPLLASGKRKKIVNTWYPVEVK